MKAKIGRNIDKMNLTIDSVKAFHRSPAIRKQVEDLLKWRKEAQRTRAHVDSYIRPLLVEMDLRDDQGNQISDPERLFLCEDDAGCAAFYAACEAAHQQNGYQVPQGYCPALMAENQVITGENALLAAASEHFNFDFQAHNMELRKKAVDLFTTRPPR